jgi:CubicO group peptidase (beta-lactamase class C family)
VVFGGGGEFGGILSTISDYARFAQMLLNGGELGGERLLSRKTVELMTTSHTGDLCIWLPGYGLYGYGYGWGLGVSVRTDMTGRSSIGNIGEYGWGGAACTLFFADPKEDMFGLMFSQVMNTPMKSDMTIREDFPRLVYQALY